MAQPERNSQKDNKRGGDPNFNWRGVVLFAIPLAFAVQRLYRGEHIAQLQRDANRVAASVPEKAAEVPPTIKRPSGMSGSVHIGVYRIDGRLISVPFSFKVLQSNANVHEVRLILCSAGGSCSILKTAARSFSLSNLRFDLV